MKSLKHKLLWKTLKLLKKLLKTSELNCYSTQFPTQFSGTDLHFPKKMNSKKKTQEHDNTYLIQRKFKDSENSYKKSLRNKLCSANHHCKTPKEMQNLNTSLFLKKIIQFAKTRKKLNFLKQCKLSGLLFKIKQYKYT